MDTSEVRNLSNILLDMEDLISKNIGVLENEHSKQFLLTVKGFVKLHSSQLLRSRDDPTINASIVKWTKGLDNLMAGISYHENNSSVTKPGVSVFAIAPVPLPPSFNIRSEGVAPVKPISKISGSSALKDVNVSNVAKTAAGSKVIQTPPIPKDFKPVDYDELEDLIDITIETPIAPVPKPALVPTTKPVAKAVPLKQNPVVASKPHFLGSRNQPAKVLSSPKAKEGSMAQIRQSSDEDDSDESEDDSEEENTSEEDDEEEEEKEDSRERRRMQHFKRKAEEERDSRRTKKVSISNSSIQKPCDLPTSTTKTTTKITTTTSTVPIVPALIPSVPLTLDNSMNQENDEKQKKSDDISNTLNSTGYRKRFPMKPKIADFVEHGLLNVGDIVEYERSGVIITGTVTHYGLFSEAVPNGKPDKPVSGSSLCGWAKEILGLTAKGNPWDSAFVRRDGAYLCTMQQIKGRYQRFMESKVPV